jgi:hypothetical protein
VARWRRCQLVVMAPLESPRWWRWWRADSRTWSMDLVDSLAFLTLAGTRNNSHPPNSKSEARNSTQIQMTKQENPKPRSLAPVLDI